MKEKINNEKTREEALVGDKKTQNTSKDHKKPVGVGTVPETNVIMKQHLENRTGPTIERRTQQPKGELKQKGGVSNL